MPSATEHRKKVVKVLGHAGLSSNAASVRRVLAALAECPEADRDGILHAKQKTLSAAVAEHAEGLTWTMSLQLAGGGTFDCPTPSFSKMLQRACQVSPVLRSRLLEIWQRSPTAPLNICIYGDEIVPGNVLRLDHSRKLFLMFWSIKELGPSILHSTAAWFPMVAIRSTKLQSIDGGVSQCVRLVLRRMLLEEKINDRGVVVWLDEHQATPVALRFRVSNLIFDGDAQRQVFCAKESVGKVPCLCCLNVVHEDASIPSASFVSLTNTDASKLQFASSEDLYEKADMLSRSAPPAMNKTRFKRLETATGIKYMPRGLLWDQELRGKMRMAETVTFDAMHILLANGMASDELACLFGTIMDRAVMGRRVVTWDDLRTFVAADFRRCFHHRSQAAPQSILGKAREDRFKRDASIGFGASEMLTIFPLLRYFVELVVEPAGLAPLAVASFKALGLVIALVTQGKQGGMDPDLLARAIRSHGEAFQAAYGCSTKTKPHWLLHIPHQLARDGMILDAFVGERSNLVAKRAAAEVDNTSKFEKSVVNRIVLDFFSALSDPHLFENRLLQPELCRGLLDTGADAWASRACVWEGLTLQRGDVLLVKEPTHWNS